MRETPMWKRTASIPLQGVRFVRVDHCELERGGLRRMIRTYRYTEIFVDPPTDIYR